MALQPAASEPSPATSPSASAAPLTPADSVAPALTPEPSAASPATLQYAVTQANAGSLLPPLPANCAAVQPQLGTSVIICAAPKESVIDKFATPSVVLSIVAIVLSLWSLLYTKRKEARARQQSIEDDYWLRKVVSPVSIEPLLQFAAQLPLLLPSSIDEPAHAKQVGQELLQKLRALSGSFLVTRLLSESVEPKVAAALELVEDGLASYLSALKQYMDTPQDKRGYPPSRPEAITNLSSALIKVLDPIKELQSRVGR